MNSELGYESATSLAKWSIYPMHCFESERLASEAEMKDLCERLSRTAADQLCIFNEEKARLKFLHFKRRRGNRRAPTHEQEESASSSDEAEDVITCMSQLGFHLERVNDSNLQQTVAYYFDARNSWSRLQITEEIIRKILANYLVHPKFIPILATFGERVNATEESYVSYFDKIQEVDPFRTTDSTIFTELSGYEAGYNIKYVARHNRDRPKDPFVVRQIGVYQKFNPRDKIGVWVLLHAASGLKDRLASLLEKFNQQPQDLALQVEMHLTILQYCGEGWRPYIAYLENFAEDLTDRGFYSQPVSRPGAESLQIETSDIRELHFLSDKLRRLLQLLNLDILLAQKLLDFVQRLMLSWSNARINVDVNTRLKSLLAGMEEHLFSLRVSQSRVAAILDRTRDISTLVRQVLDFRNEASSRAMSLNLQQLTAASVEENQHMSAMAAKGAKDTKMMKLITIITATFLPATFVASIFGTNFFNYSSETKGIVGGFSGKQTWRIVWLVVFRRLCSTRGVHFAKLMRKRALRHIPMLDPFKISCLNDMLTLIAMHLQFAYS
ncbi:hypothetical protein TWF281_003867 [Arthrobotrys megalospora]